MSGLQPVQAQLLLSTLHVVWSLPNKADVASALKEGVRQHSYSPSVEPGVDTVRSSNEQMQSMKVQLKKSAVADMSDAISSDITISHSRC